jgi:hypothetical protein
MKNIIIDNKICNYRMKKRIAIIFAGQIRSNSLSDNYTSDNIIIDSLKEYFLNNEFNEKYDYDVFISTDNINIEKAKLFFGDNLKNIYFYETKWFLNEIEEDIIEYNFFKEKYLKTDFGDYPNHIEALYQYYRIYCGYLLSKDYEKKNNIKYDYYVRIRLDIRLMQDLNSLFDIIETTNKKIIIEHEMLVIISKEFEEIFNFINYYGYFTDDIHTFDSKYSYYVRDFHRVNQDTNNKYVKFSPERQVLDYIEMIIIKNNKNFEEIFLGITYPSFSAMYRGNGNYGYLYNDIDLFKPYQSIEYIKNKICNYRMKKRIAIIFAGQIRSNSLSNNYASDNIILNSLKEYFLNNEFNEKYDYDVFISTEKINIEKAKLFFGDHLKNIYFYETKWFLNEIEEDIIEYNFFKEKYLKTDFGDYPNHIEELYQYYRVYCGYLLSKDYEKKNNIKYDYYVRIRPDSRLMQDLNSLFDIIETTNKKIIFEDEQLWIVSKEFEEIFNFINYYGYFTDEVECFSYKYNLYIKRDNKIGMKKDVKFCSKRQIMDYVELVVNSKKKKIEEVFVGMTYPSFNLLYRGDDNYGYSDYKENKVYEPYHSIEYIKNIYL